MVYTSRPAAIMTPIAITIHTHSGVDCAVTGGIIGILVGWGVSKVITSMGTFTTLISPDIVLLAFSISVGIGIFFGFYPAWQASKLRPIEALRHE